MDTMYQRGKIQEESLHYGHKKHDGSLPLVGVNMFLPKQGGGEVATEIELIRSTEEEKGQQIANVQTWQTSRNAVALPVAAASALPPLPPGEGRGRAPPPPTTCQKPNTCRIFSAPPASAGACSRR